MEKTKLSQGTEKMLERAVWSSFSNMVSAQPALGMREFLHLRRGTLDSLSRAECPYQLVCGILGGMEKFYSYTPSP